MKSTKGFCILSDVIVFTLSTILLFTAFRTYQQALSTFHRKLLLEDAIALAEASLADTGYTSSLSVIPVEHSIHEALQIKEVQICHNDKIIFSLAKAQ